MAVREHDRAPTTIVSPLMATEVPKLSGDAVSKARNFRCRLQTLAAAHRDIGRALGVAVCAIVKRRADDHRFPADRHRDAEKVICRRVRGQEFLLLGSRHRRGVQRHRPSLDWRPLGTISRAPITTVSPPIATEKPNRSSSAASEATSWSLLGEGRVDCHWPEGVAVVHFQQGLGLGSSILTAIGASSLRPAASLTTRLVVSQHRPPAASLNSRACPPSTACAPNSPSSASIIRSGSPSRRFPALSPA